MGAHREEEAPAPGQLTHQVRRLAAALRAARSTEQLYAVVSNAIQQLPGCSGLELEPMPSGPAFDAARLAVPLIGSSGSLGLMRATPGPRGSFGPDELRLAGAVADLAGAVIDRCLRGGGGDLSLLLSVALDGLSVGVLCFDPAGVLLFANAAARGMLAGSLPAQWGDFWREHAPGSRAGTEHVVLRRGEGNLLHVTARRGPPGAPRALVLTDLAPRVASFGAHLAAECYRSLVEKRPLGLALVAAPEGSLTALGVLDSGRDAFPADARAGLVDAESAGIVAPGADAGSLWRLLRLVGRHAGLSGLLGGVARLRETGDSPQALLARATAALRPLPAADRPEVFVFDRSAAVTETVAMILRHACAVTGVPDPARGLAVLRDRPFEGMILELPAASGGRDLDWLRTAVALQPAARLFYLSEIAPPWELRERGLPVAPVFRKPFVVEKMRAAVREALLGPAGDA